MKKLTNKEKIEVLERAIKELSERRGFCLCATIRNCLGGEIIYNSKIGEYIDLFTLENSRKFSSRAWVIEDGYWFGLNSGGNEERIKFLEWMIQEYEKREKKES